MKSRYFAMMGASLLLAANPTCAERLRLESAGVRMALSQRKSGNNFYQSEAFANWNLPWHPGKDTGLHCQSLLDLSAGWLHGWSEDGFISTLAPDFSMGWKRLPIFVECGLGPTILSRDSFGPTDFGNLIQFTTHGGLTWECGSRLSVGYRYQHMSNGGLAAPNPGLNLHSISAGWRF